jgi:hypothetical protein
MVRLDLKKIPGNESPRREKTDTQIVLHGIYSSCGYNKEVHG